MTTFYMIESLADGIAKASHPTSGTSAACVEGGAGTVLSAATVATRSGVDLDLNRLYPQNNYFPSTINVQGHFQPQQQQTQMQESVISGQHSLNPSSLWSHEPFYHQQENLNFNSILDANSQSTNEHKLPVPMANIYGASTYSSSGYINKDMQQQTTPGLQQEILQNQVVAQDTYTFTKTSPPQQQHNLMDIYNMQPNNTLQLEPSYITTEQQLPPNAAIPTTSMVSMLPQQQYTELQPPNRNFLQIPPSNITIDKNTNIQTYPQLQQPASVLPPVEQILTSPHTITGNNLANAEIFTSNNSDVLNPASGHQQQVIQTSDVTLLQFTSTGSTGATDLNSYYSYTSHTAQNPPQQGNIPAFSNYYSQGQTIANSPTFTSSSTISAAETANSDLEYNPEKEKPVEEKPQRQKQKRTSNTSSSLRPNSAMLENGRAKCFDCNKEFTKACYLTQHNNSFHCGEYPYRCQKCGKRYQSEDVYTVHLAKHTTTDKAHKCELCPKQFHYKTDLRRHIEAIHTGNKQHCCNICDKKFCRKDHLNKHLKTHVKLQ